MIFTGITPDQVAAITERVSRERYAGNPVVKWVRNPYNAAPKLLNTAGTRFRGEIAVWNSRGPGSRTSASGRHGPYACWHVFRDVLEEVIMRHGARVSTSMARYTPETWHERYPRTAEVNIGSAFRPVTMPELCDCTGETRRVVMRHEDLRPLPVVEGIEPRLTVVEKKAYDLQTSVDYINSLLGI